MNLIDNALNRMRAQPRRAKRQLFDPEGNVCVKGAIAMGLDSLSEVGWFVTRRMSDPRCIEASDCIREILYEQYDCPSIPRFNDSDVSTEEVFAVLEKASIRLEEKKCRT